MKKSLALVGVLALLTSCTSIGQKMSDISPGMAKADVVRILGKPTSTAGAGNVEVLHYFQHFKVEGYHFVRLVDGKVESYGRETPKRQVTYFNPPLKN